MPNKYKAILFDMDGVITDTMPFHYEAWKKIFKSLGISLDKHEIYKREGEKGIVSISQILALYGLKISHEEKIKLLQDKEALFKKISQVRLFPGIEKLITSLKTQGYLLALVTGTSRGELDYILPSFLLKSFDVVVTGDAVAHGKPAPDPYLKGLNELKVKANESIVIENAPYGIKSAKDAGIFCIAITTSLPSKYLKEANIIFDSLDKVGKLIFELN